MKKILLIVFSILIFSIPAFSQNIKVSGIASKGGKIIRTSATTQHVVMETFPSATVTVYQTGTLTLASIFSNEVGTPKANPFTANSDASWSFYIASGRYDIKFSGTGIISPFTLSDIFVNSGSGGGGGGAVTSVFGRTGDIVYQVGDVPFTGLNFTGSNFNLITVRSASDLNAGVLPDAVFPSVLPALNGINLINLNASNISTGTVNDARLSSNIPLKNASNTFTQNNLFTANIGINTLTPDRRLEVLDGSGAQLRLTSVDNSAFTDLFVDSGGSLNFLPTGNVAFDSVGNQVNPLNNFDQNLGQINKKWLSLHAAELFVETLVAQNTIATIGGRIIVAPTNQLIADLSSISTIISVKYNNLANGDRIYMEGNNSVEFMAVTSGASTISGGFSYSVTRNLDGTGSNDWFAGDALVNTGVSGDGFIDLYSVRGVKSGTQIGPTIVGNVRNSTTFNDWTENWAIGNLNGIYGYGSDIYGVALGKYAADNTHITVDSTNGVRIFDGLATIRTRFNPDGSGFLANNNISWDASGVTTIAGWLINSTTINSSTTIIASGSDIPAAPFSWFGRSVAGYSGVWLKDSINRDVSLLTGSGLGPRIQVTDGTRNRIVLGDLNFAWNPDGATNSIGMKIWDSSGNKLLEFSDVQNKIAGLTIGTNKMYIGAGSFNNSNTSFYVDDAGQFSLKDKLSWNGATLNISGNIALSAITSTLTLTGASSAIAIGNPTAPTSPTTGTGVYIDRNGVYSILSNTQTARFDAIGLTIPLTLTNENIIYFQHLTTAENIMQVAAARNPAGFSGSRGQIFTQGNNTFSDATMQMWAQEFNAVTEAHFDVYSSPSSARANLYGVGFNGLVIGSTSTATPTSMLDVRSDSIRISTAKTPSSAADTCTQGIIAWDSNFMYVCVATNTWKRSAISTW